MEHDIPCEAAPGAAERLPVPPDDDVAGAESRRVFRAFLFHGPDLELGHFGGFLRKSGDPDDASQGQTEKDVEERAGEGGDHAFPRLGLGQLVSVFILYDVVRGVDLRKIHISAAGDPADPVLHAVDLLRPGLAEPDGEGHDMQSAQPRRQKVAQFMDENARAEKEDHEERGSDHLKDIEQHVLYDSE